MAFLDNTAGAVATLIGAAMETAGTRMQSQFLDLMVQPFGESITAFLYLIGIVTAVMTVAIGGHFKFANYLLLGPALFSFVITQRVTISGADWRFADRLHPQSEVIDLLKDVDGGTPTGNGGGKVSILFQGWNLLMTDITQLGLSLLSLTDTDSDLDFTTKMDRYMSQYTNVRVEDPELRKFVQMALINECSDYYVMQIQVESPYVDLPTQNRIKARILHRQNQVVFNLDTLDDQRFDALKDWLRKVAKSEQTHFTCQELWTFAIAQLRQHSVEILKKLATQHLPDEASSEQAFEKLALKFGIRTNPIDGAVEGLTPLDGKADSTHVALMLNEVSARILFRELINQTPFQRMIALDKHSGVAWSGENQIGDRASRNIRIFMGPEQYQFKGEFITTALAMPYFQGLVLYGLAATFPFFAVFLVIPGKHTAILIWMGLWAWVKLWDFGFGVVMMIDDMLYSMFPHPETVSNDKIQNAGKAWRAILMSDPTYNMTAYYNIIAVCLFAVPVVTGFLVKKGGGDLIGAVSGGSSQYVQRLAGAYGNYAKSMLAQTQNAKAQGHVYNSSRKAAMDALNDPQVQKNLMESLGIQMGNKTLGEFKAELSKSTNLGETMQTFAKAAKGSKQVAALARMNYLTQLGSYQASISSDVRRAANDAIISRFNTHDFSGSFPGGALMSTYLAENYFETGKVAEAGIKEIVKGRGGSSKK